MNEPKVIKGYTFDEIIKNAELSHQTAIKELKKNGGKCLSCGKHPACFTAVESINPFNCIECNKDTEELIKQLSKDAGFMHISL